MPGLGRRQVGIPERPGAALPGSGGIDRAVARFAVEKDAIAIGEFAQALANADGAHVFVLEFLDVPIAYQSGQRGDLFGVHPYEPGRSRAAIAAFGALELETG